MFSMVLVGSGFRIQPFFYTDPDPGKLYGFHGSGSATLPVTILFWIRLFKTILATRNHHQMFLMLLHELQNKQWNLRSCRGQLRLRKIPDTLHKSWRVVVWLPEIREKLGHHDAEDDHVVHFLVLLGDPDTRLVIQLLQAENMLFNFIKRPFIL